jgi:hypothetical protein
MPSPSLSAAARRTRLISAFAGGGVVVFCMAYAALALRASRHRLAQAERERELWKERALSVSGPESTAVGALVEKVDPAIRERELQDVIDFLRRENAAADATIERLEKALPRLPEPNP